MSSLQMDEDLWLTIATIGVQFLGRTYDLVPGNDGYCLRIVDRDGALIAFEPCGHDKGAVISFLKQELEAATYNHILGYPIYEDQTWSKETKNG